MPIHKSNRFQKYTKFYTPREFMKFITSAKEIATKKETTANDLSEWNYYVFFNIAYHAGLRKCEIHALKWSDIDNQYLTVPKMKSPERTLKMSLPLIKILNEHKQRQRQSHNFTDDFKICGNIKDPALQRKNKIYSINAGLRTVRIHDFRNSHISKIAGGNILRRYYLKFLNNMKTIIHTFHKKVKTTLIS